MGRKVVYNACYGGFGLSALAEKKLFERKNPGKTAHVYQEVNSDICDETKDEIYVRVDPEKLSDREYDIYVVCHDFGDSFVILMKEKETNSGNYRLFNDSFIWAYSEGIERHDPDLVAIVEELGEKANGMCANLKILDIGNEKYHIDEYDGYESVITNLGDDYWH